MMRPTIVFVALIVFMMCFGAAALVFAQSAPYFQGKTIMLIQGREPGGTGALRTQALIPFLRKYIPGEPIIVTQFMPGGGGRKATNYISRNAKPDGLTIGNMGSGLVANAVLGSTGVEYDIDKLIYLGAANSTAQYVFNSVAKLGLDSIDKLRARPGLRVGAQTVGHDIYINGRLFSWLLGLKEPKFVTGYSGPELDVAMMGGELDARANIPDTILQRSPEYIEKKLVNFHAIIQIPKEDRHPHPAFAKLPELESFRQVGSREENYDDVSNLPLGGFSLHSSTRHSPRTGQHLARGHAENLQRPDVPQRVQETFRGRCHSPSAGGTRKSHQGYSTRCGNRDPFQQASRE